MGALQSRSGADGAPPAEGPDGVEALDGAGAPAEALDGAVALVEGPADPKRRREASGIIERVFEKEDNLSRVLAFTGFTAVYNIEKLSSAAHKATRAAKFAIEVQRLERGGLMADALPICHSSGLAKGIASREPTATPVVSKASRVETRVRHRSAEKQQPRPGAYTTLNSHETANTERELRKL